MRSTLLVCIRFYTNTYICIHGNYLCSVVSYIYSVHAHYLHVCVLIRMQYSCTLFMHICSYTYIAFMHIAYMYLFLYVCSIDAYICIFFYTYIHICMYMYVCIYIYIYICICICMYMYYSCTLLVRIFFHTNTYIVFINITYIIWSVMYVCVCVFVCMLH
jgi:hypothetical protein